MRLRSSPVYLAIFITTLVTFLGYTFFSGLRWMRVLSFLGNLDSVGDPRPVYISPLEVENKNLSHLIHLLRHRSSPIPLITMVNAAYLPLANSWLCNTNKMIGVHNITVVITTDRKSYVELNERWGIRMADHPAIFHLPLDEKLSRSHLFNQAGYRTYLFNRIHLLKQLIDQGVSFLLFEVDAVWFRNPLPEVHRLAATDTKIDVWAARLGASEFYEQKNMSVNFMLAKATPSAKKLWGELHRVLAEQINGTYEQEEMDKMCKAGVGGVRCQVLPYELVADGNWYFNDKRHGDAPWPAVINNNYIRGINSKIERAKAYQHWFWKEEERKCDQVALNRDVST